jgi:hypothetical protein
MTILAQSAVITDAPRLWGDQLFTPGLGLLGLGTLVYLFLKQLK